MISFQTVNKKYLPEAPLLDDISFSLNPRECLWVNGPSGSGKTTLLRLAYGLEKPTSGKIMLSNIDISSLSLQSLLLLRQRMGITTEIPRLIKDKTVFNNVAIPLMIQNQRPAIIKQRVRSLLDKFELLSKQNALPNMLSQQEKQKACLARAIIHNPTLLLLDEPFLHLDAQTTRAFCDLFEYLLTAGVSILIASRHPAPTYFKSAAQLTLQYNNIYAH